MLIYILKMSKVITRIDLIKMLMIKFSLSRDDASLFLKEIIFAISGALKENDCLKISSFGSFCKIKRDERIGTNPKTKEPMIINGRKVIKFKPSGQMKNDVKKRLQILIDDKNIARV